MMPHSLLRPLLILLLIAGAYASGLPLDATVAMAATAATSSSGPVTPRRLRSRLGVVASSPAA